MIVGVAAGCSDPLEREPARFMADLVLAPTIEAVAPAPPINQVRVRVGRAPAEGVLDTTVAFPTDASQLSLRLQVALKASSERLGVTVDLLSGGQIYFSGSDTVLVVALGSGPAASPRLVLKYVGPGSTIRTLRVGPRDSTLAFGDPLTLRLSALDAQGAAVTNYPVTWSTTDPQVSISQTGALVAPPRRITVKVVATIPTGLADTVALTFVPKPVAMSLVSGTGQTGRPLAALSVPFAVLVKAADSLPMAGVAVTFVPVPPPVGAATRDTTVITTSQGQAATTMVLGGSAGVYRYEARVLGVPAVALTAIATAGPPARLLYQSGGAQVARVNTPQAQALVALVTDIGGIPVGGATVVWQVVAGGGQVSASNSVTNAAGLASITATTGTIQGLSMIRATIANIPPAQVTFASFGTAGPVTSIQTFNGNGAPPSSPATLQVRLSDGFGNPVPGTKVTWAITRGTGNLSASSSNSGGDGLASVDYAPNNQNDVDIGAAVGGLNVTFLLPANQNPTALVPKSGGGQTGIVTQGLPNPVVARLSDLGLSTSGATVNWQILEGGGSLSAVSSITDTSGSAFVSYTAGTKAGTSRIQARDPVSGLVANFSFAIGPALPAQLLPASGDNQSAAVGAVPALPLRVVIVDANNNPVPGILVGWAALDGGSVAAASTTDQFGVAAATISLGLTRGPQRFQATSGSLVVTFIVTGQ